MKGIAGLLFFDGSPDAPFALGGVLSKLGKGRVESRCENIPGGVLFQLDSGAQVHDGSRAVKAVIDGSIHNAPQLRSALHSAAATEADHGRLAELAHEAWGTDAPPRLEGDFSCATWDGRTGTLHCFVDAAASRPLYYTHNSRFFAFSSSEESLLALPGMTARPKDEMVASLLVLELRDVNPADGWLAGIHCVPAGCVVSVRPGNDISVRKYWNWYLGDEYSFTSPAEAEEAFRERFSTAVRRRLPQNRFGLMLSGGMDSTAIRATLDLLDIPPSAYRTYSAVSDPALECIESAAIRDLSRANEALHLTVPGPDAPGLQRDMLNFISDGHPRDSSLLLPAMMCVAAEREGVTTMLHGVSGDPTLWTPDRYISYLLRDGSWQEAWRECSVAGRNNNFLLGRSPALLLALNAWTAWAPAPAKRLLFRVAPRRKWLAPRLRLQPEFEQRLKIRERLARKSAEEAKSRQLASRHGAEYVQALTSPFSLALGAGAYAQLGRRLGVEMSDPWCDRSLIEYFCHLPIRYKIRDGWTKHIVRTSLSQYAPASAIWRRGKEHLGGPLCASFMEANREWVLDQFSDLGPLEPYVDVSQVREAVLEFADAQERHTDQFTLVRHMLYETLAMLSWLRRLSAL